MWIFGYGSLIWRPDIPHQEACPAYVEGWARRFWQGSPDHRGTPEAPGRVVTLTREPGSRTWGMAYRLASHAAVEVLPGLDHRERGGYERHDVWLHFQDGRAAASGLVYVAPPTNPHYLGPAALPDIAAQVRRSHGESGPNVDYILRLAESLRQMGAEDAHVFALEALLLAPPR